MMARSAEDERTDTEAQVRANLAAAKIHAEEVAVRSDPMGGIRVGVVASAFAALSHPERRNVTLGGLKDESLQGVQLLTPEEAATLKVPLATAPELEDLPLWPEALARPLDLGKVRFASDLDEELPGPLVATFYSLRGGVGRSTALAYCAQILARRGQTVLAVDMDVEAPGLAALFGKEDEVGADQGLVSLLHQTDLGNEPDLAPHVLRVSDTSPLYCLPAGVLSADYARKLSMLNPVAWYHEDPSQNPLRRVVDRLKTELPFTPDVILIDARTGYNPLGGPLLFDLADLAVIVFFPHPQSERGTRLLVRALLGAHNQRRDASGQRLTPEPRFVVSPIPNAQGIVDIYKNQALDWIRDWMTPLYTDIRPRNYWESEITEFIPYREAIATSSRVLREQREWQDYEPIADWLDGFVPERKERLPPLRWGRGSDAIAHTNQNKVENLDRLILEFSRDSVKESIIYTAAFEQALSPANSIVVGADGVGKTTAFGLLLERTDRWPIPVLAPSDCERRGGWNLDGAAFLEIQRIREQSELSRSWWDGFWTVYIGQAMHQYWPDNLQSLRPPLPDEQIVLRETSADALGAWLAAVSRRTVEEHSVWLQNLIRHWTTSSKDREPLLLFDGIESLRALAGAQRREAIDSLLSLTAFKPLMKRLKIFLPMDFAHSYSKQLIRLDWSDADQILLIAIVRTAYRLGSDISDSDWESLFGSSLRGLTGAKTAAWLVENLTDGAGQRRPRDLLQLTRFALELEREANKQRPYLASILRPRVVREALRRTSQVALKALVDVYPTLTALCERIRAERKEIISGEDDDAFSGALESGLLERYVSPQSESGTQRRRYRVANLYRDALLGAGAVGPSVPAS